MGESAVIYCRVSRKEQVENFSLATQESGCRDYCTRQGWKVARVFVEKGESAKTIERTEFQRMLSWCREHKESVGYVVVYNLSRFARNQFDHHAIRALLRKLGIALRSVTEPVDDSPMGSMIEGVLSAVHQFENELRGERALTGMKAALRAGKWCWVAPFGYVTGADGLEIDEPSASIVRSVFERVAAGEAPNAVYGEMGERGLTICRSDFYKMLERPLYCGIVENRSWGIRTEGTHAPIVSRELWDRVQTVLAGEHGGTYKAVHDDFPLRGFVRCPDCGESLTAGWSKGRSRRYGYYRCKCPKSNVRHEDLELEFVDLLRSIRPTARYMEAFRRTLLGRLEKDIHAAEATQRSLRGRLSGIKAKRQRLVEAYVYDEAIGRETYESQLDRLNQLEATLRTRSHEAEIAEIDAESLLGWAMDVALHCDSFWRQCTAVQKQSLQRFIFPDGLEWKDGGFLNPSRSPLFQENRRPDESEIRSGRGESPRFEPFEFLHSIARLRQSLGVAA